MPDIGETVFYYEGTFNPAQYQLPLDRLPQPSFQDRVHIAISVNTWNNDRLDLMVFKRSLALSPHKAVKKFNPNDLSQEGWMTQKEYIEWLYQSQTTQTQFALSALQPSPIPPRSVTSNSQSSQLNLQL